MVDPRIGSFVADHAMAQTGSKGHAQHRRIGSQGGCIGSCGRIALKHESDHNMRSRSIKACDCFEAPRMHEGPKLTTLTMMATFRHQNQGQLQGWRPRQPKLPTITWTAAFRRTTGTVTRIATLKSPIPATVRTVETPRMHAGLLLTKVTMPNS